MPDDHASSREQETAARRIRVLLPLPLPEALDYLGPEGTLPPEPGSFVNVPLGQRSLTGVFWHGVGDELPEDRLKPIIETLPTPRLRPELRRFVERVAAYTMAPPGAVLRMTMSVPEALLSPRPRRLCSASPIGMAALDGPRTETRLTPARRRVLEVLCAGPPMPAAEVARRAACSTGVVRDLITAKLVEVRFASAEMPKSPSPDWRLCGPQLSPDQSIAAQRLVSSVEATGFRVTVLDGVTGSGKTETYFAALAAALAAGRQVLVLLPEIALGAQWLDRFKRRFGALPAEWHSDVSQSTRRDTWRAVASGRARIVVGARSGLFLPFPELGLVIVDEEHDASYKQEDGGAYQARDMAVLRASIAEVPIVLVSATPSLATVVNVARGRYERVHLPRRHADASLPKIDLVDMRSQRLEPGRFLSPPLVAAVGQTLAASEQVLLFLNRRGYAPLTLCRACGHRLQCPNCPAWLVQHRFTARLQCHHCGYGAPVPAFCPDCLAGGSLVPCGPGVERLRE